MPHPLTSAHSDSGQGARSSLAPALKNAGAGAGRLHTGHRSARFLEALAGLDGSASLAPDALDKVVDDVRAEFVQQWATEPLGIVGTCYLGPPYEVHTLTLDDAIIEHFPAGRPLPAELEPARVLLRSGAYCVVEVYPDRLLCVRVDGSLAELEVPADDGGAP